MQQDNKDNNKITIKIISYNKITKLNKYVNGEVDATKMLKVCVKNSINRISRTTIKKDTNKNINRITIKATPRNKFYIRKINLTT